MKGRRSSANRRSLPRIVGRDGSDRGRRFTGSIVCKNALQPVPTSVKTARLLARREHDLLCHDQRNQQRDPHTGEQDYAGRVHDPILQGPLIEQVGAGHGQ